MTAPRHAEPLAAESVDDAAALLRKRGMRFSAARRLVLEALFAADRPLTADAIAEDSRTDVTSVYRNLEALEAIGLHRHVHLGHGPGLYALAGEREREYLTCERCGAYEAVDPGQLDDVRALVRERFGYQAHFSHFPIGGLCARCLTQRSDMSEHEHSHGDITHSHPHTDDDHEHVEHAHEHAHGDETHSHPHVHEEGLEHEHDHTHDN
jgi:Fur family ferric uptake transcriptional regulator